METNWEKILKEVGAIAIKCGTEAEKQTAEEITRFSMYCPGLEPHIKIGGPEDCSALKTLYNLGYRNFIAPLIESEFSAKKFISAAAWVTNGKPESLHLSLNLESVSAYQNVNHILTVEETQKYIGKINVGKTDLGLSIGHPAHHETVLTMAATIVNRAKMMGKRTGIGGAINVRTIEHELAVIQPHQFETRHVIFDCSKVVDPVKAVEVALAFENFTIAMETKLIEQARNDLEKRMRGLRNRLAREVILPLQSAA